MKVFQFWVSCALASLATAVEDVEVVTVTAATAVPPSVELELDNSTLLHNTTNTTESLPVTEGSVDLNATTTTTEQVFGMMNETLGTTVFSVEDNVTTTVLPEVEVTFTTTLSEGLNETFTTEVPTNSSLHPGLTHHLSVATTNTTTEVPTNTTTEVPTNTTTEVPTNTTTEVPTTTTTEVSTTATSSKRPKPLGLDHHSNKTTTTQVLFEKTATPTAPPSTPTIPTNLDGLAQAVHALELIKKLDQ